MPTLTTEFVSRLRPDPNQPRRTFVEEELRRLAESLKQQGQKEPLQIQPDRLIIDGERRWRAAQLAGIEKLDVIVTDRSLTPTEMAIARLTSFFHKIDLSDPEKSDACQELLKLNSGWTLGELAEHLNVCNATVTQLMAVFRTIPAVQDAYRAGRLSKKKVYAIAQADAARQHQMLEAALKGESCEELSRAAKRSRNGDKPPVRAGKIKIELPSGMTVVFSSKGREIALDEAIRSAPEVLKFLKEGQIQGYTAKTISKMSAEKAESIAKKQPANVGPADASPAPLTRPE